MQTITALINDHAGAANPLIYTIEVNDPADEIEVMMRVTEARRDDVGSDADLDLELLIVFGGDCKVLGDWRE